MPELDRLVRRLRSYTARGWRENGRSERVRRLAADLITIGGSGHDLPELGDPKALPDHALPDVVSVLAAEAMAHEADTTTALLDAALTDLQ